MSDLNEAVARAMGWELETDEHGGMWVIDGGSRYDLPNFRHIDSLTDARWLEDVIEARGLQRQYMNILANVIDAMPFDDVLFQWTLIRATPEQRAQAFIAAINAVGS